MLQWLKSLMKVPEPAGPPELLSRFDLSEATISPIEVSSSDNAWKIGAPDDPTVRLFEMEGLDLEQCQLTYRAKIRCKGVGKRVYLEMWVRAPGRGEFFSKGYHNSITGTHDWSTVEIPFHLKAGQRADHVKLNVVLEGGGTVWLRDVELFRTPMQ